jgi:beta-ureidopropionase / N-carbamoyl-L-amino-acid hydrolase
MIFDRMVKSFAGRKDPDDRETAMTTPGANLRINSARLWDSLMEMALIGPGIAGGNNRQTLTDADAAGRALFLGWCQAAGMTMGVDTMGNMFATRAGEEDLDPVYMGSHLDTQPTGGKFDGVLGVLGGLEVIRSMNDAGIKTRHPIVLTNWTNEEGARFAPAMLASGVFAGIHTQDYAYGRMDPDGKRFGDELARIGWVGTEVVGARKIHAMLELHIEQGPILEAEGKAIGVVTHGQGLWWLEVTLTGVDAHTGSTPMSMRANAGLGMARVVERVHQIAMGHQPGAVGTVGQMNVFPNSRNVIPGRVVFTVDIRSPDQGKLDAMRGEVERAVAAVAAELGLGFGIEAVGHFDPVTFDPGLVGVVRGAAERLGYSHMDIISGAGHDACWINRVAPTVMVMCPCVGGLSHNEAEEISPDWAAAGTDVLLHAVLDVAGVVG